METASYNISDIKLFLKNQFRDKTTFLTVFFFFSNIFAAEPKIFKILISTKNSWHILIEVKQKSITVM
jgi:hypothetical protein